MVKEKALKKLLVLTALVICSTDIFAQTTEKQWENLITAISAVESKHDPRHSIKTETAQAFFR